MIQIVLLHHNRNNYQLLCKELNLLPDNIKKELCLNIYTSDQKISNHQIPNLSIPYNIYKLPFGVNYLFKIQQAALQIQYDYTIKLDDDIIVSANSLISLIDSVKHINDKNVLTTPLVSTGIPTVELFMNEIFDDEIIQIFNRMCIETKIPKEGIWPGYTGDKYLTLNKHRDSWPDNFYTDVESLDIDRKGIHPVRISEPIQSFINKNLLDKNVLNKIRNSNQYEPTTINSYFCNSVFLIKTDIWADILHRRELYVDDFDEVPINKFVKQNNLNMLTLKGCYAIHPYYNTVSNHLQLESLFVEKYLDLIA